MKKKLSKLELALKKIAAALQAYVNDHIADIENPHGVTKTQIGLGNVTNDAQVKRSEMGVAEGVATLNTNGKVPDALLPNYKDVIEGYYSNGSFYTAPPITHDYVEIGGTKWATKNVGANNITDTGLYFAWGDIQGYTTAQMGSGEGQKYFSWTDYKYGNGTSNPGAAGMTKYNSTDGKIVLDLSDDAAHTNMGGNWRMPTATDFRTLGEVVNTAWTTDYLDSGVRGLVCTDKTDSSKVLFFPAAGYCYSGSVSDMNIYGYYWSSSLRATTNEFREYAYTGLTFRPNNVYWGFNSYKSRYYGCSIRGIWDGPIPTAIIPVAGVLYVDINSNKLYRWNGTAYVETSSNSYITDLQILNLFEGLSLIDNSNVVVGNAASTQSIQALWSNYNPMAQEN